MNFEQLQLKAGQSFYVVQERYTEGRGTGWYDCGFDPFFTSIKGAKVRIRSERCHYYEFRVVVRAFKRDRVIK